MRRGVWRADVYELNGVPWLFGSNMLVFPKIAQDANCKTSVSVNPRKERRAEEVIRVDVVAG